MKELICPNCHKAFTVNEEDYASIVSQVKTAEFDAELERRIASLHDQHKAEEKLAAANAEKNFQATLNQKDIQLSAKDAEIDRLKSQLDAAADKSASEMKLAIATKEQEIAKLQSAINEGDSKMKIALMEAQGRAKEQLQAKETEIAQLKANVDLEKQKAANEANAIKESYEMKMGTLQEQVDYYKDLKTKMSTKMVGETLEQHCSIQFEQYIRPYMPFSDFGKDNDAKEGSKGDFIFRDREDGTEYISIMFEMKNEMDTTTTKHKNDDFLKKLDEDRKKKGCEYAVLVSLLEADNDLYNNGIVDKSHLYEKMYVIRPQFFVPFINLLVQASKKTIRAKKELEMVKNRELDLSNFESSLLDFRDKFGNNYRLASEQFNKAIDEIDKSIDHMKKIKDELLKSERNLRLANDKAQKLTIESVTKDAPSVRKELYELRKAAEDAEATE